MRMVGLVECGTHVVFDVAIAGLRTGEHALARQVFRSLQPGMQLLADHGFFAVDLWQTALTVCRVSAVISFGPVDRIARKGLGRGRRGWAIYGTTN